MDSKTCFASLIEFADMETLVVHPPTVTNLLIDAAGPEYADISYQSHPEQFVAMSQFWVNAPKISIDNVTPEFFNLNQESIVILAGTEYSLFQDFTGYYCRILKKYDNQRFRTIFPFA